MHFKRLLAAGLLFLTFLSVGCTSKEESVDSPNEILSEEAVDVENPTSDDINPEPPIAEEVSQEPEKVEIDLQEVKPNEVGEIMVVMYHSLGSKNATYVRTTESFKSDLEMLYERGIRFDGFGLATPHIKAVRPVRDPILLGRIGRYWVQIFRWG